MNFYGLIREPVRYDKRPLFELTQIRPSASLLLPIANRLWSVRFAQSNFEYESDYQASIAFAHCQLPVDEEATLNKYATTSINGICSLPIAHCHCPFPQNNCDPISDHRESTTFAYCLLPIGQVWSTKSNLHATVSLQHSASIMNILEW
jgi:hypothetical protein